jgi:urease accessory protein
VHRGGQLVWGDALHLEGDIAGIIDDPACFDGAAAFATMILAPAGRDPRGFLDCARKVQSASATDAVRSGVTAIAGLVVARWLAADAASLRRAYTDLASHLRREAMGLAPRLPRLWQI